MPRLEYATPHTRQPLRPILIKPSRRSLILILLTIPAFIWLSNRHHPWHRIQSIPFTPHSNSRPRFFNDELIIVPRGAEGIALHDARTGLQTSFTQRPPQLADSADLSFFTTGHHVIIADTTHPLAWIYDLRTAQCIRTLPNPRAGGHRIVAVSAKLDRIGTFAATFADSKNASVMNCYLLWSIPPQGSDQPLGLLAKLPFHGKYSAVWFTKDGKRILFNERRVDEWRAWPCSIGLIDIDPFKLLWEFSGDEHQRGITPTGDNRFLTLGEEKDRDAVILHIRSDLDGSRIKRIRIPATRPWCSAIDSISTNSKRAFLVPGIMAIGEPSNAIIADLDSDRSSHQLDYFDYGATIMLPDGQRIVAHDFANRSFRILQASRPERPISILPCVSNCSPADRHFGFSCVVLASPDSSTLALVSSDQVDLYRPTGRDCPESILGLLAFPQTWLLSLLFLAVVISLKKDAGRAVHFIPHLSTFFLLFAFPRTLQFLLTAATGHFLATPAPLLLLAAIGLATQSRFWRFTALVILSLQLPINLYCLHHLHKAGLANSFLLPILDRTWSIPTRPLYYALAAITLLVPLALTRLASRRLSSPMV